VVPWRAGTALTPEALHGRVEHIMSGQATLFTSLEALRAFMAQVLTSPGRAPGGARGARGRQRHAAVAPHTHHLIG
jgi:hypothetical protein